MSGTHHDHAGSDADMALRTQALESLLVEKGLITTDVIDAVVRTYEQDVGPLNGAKVVARAWIDPAYKQRLLADATAAVAEHPTMTFGSSTAGVTSPSRPRNSAVAPSFRRSTRPSRSHDSLRRSTPPSGRLHARHARRANLARRRGPHCGAVGPAVPLE